MQSIRRRYLRTGRTAPFDITKRSGIIIMPPLPAGCDVPPGRTDSIASGITGRPLTYFTPDPLPELLSRLSPGNAVPMPPAEDADAAFMLVRAAALRNSAGIDIGLATRFCEILSSKRHLATTSEILRTGAALSPRAASLRQEIVFSGGPIASFSEQIFAPSTELPRLLKALAETMESLQEAPGQPDPILLAAVVGFYSVHTHPFLDANGRWSRLQSAYAAKAIGSPLTAMISAAMQSSARDRLANEIWPNTRKAGFREYLTFANRYHESMVKRLSPTLTIASQIKKELSRSISNRRGLTAAMTELHTTGQLELSNLRASAGLSMRSALGIASRISEITGEPRLNIGNAVQIHQLHELVIKVSKECAFE